MLKQSLLSFGLLFLLGCTGAPAPATPAPTQPQGDPALYRIFAQVPLDTAAREALDAYELAHERDFLERVAAVAEDPNAGTSARYNAVTLLGERNAAGWIESLRAASSDRDPRVRAAVVVAASRIMAKHGSSGRSLVVAALDDAAPPVQTKALEVLGTDDLALLRTFLVRHPKGDPAKVARDFLVLAEQRGAPAQADSSGVLHRLLPNEGTLEFRPVARWQQWHAAFGTVELKPASGGSVRIDSVEVVKDFIPMVFSPDGRFAAYERQRRVYVRDLRDGTVRELGPGLAPRAMPFSEDFVFFREIPARRGDLQERTRLVYDVVRASFAVGGEPAVLGTVGGFSSPGMNGNYSPVRWAQVVERGTTYTLEAEGLETFKLPDPFKAPPTGDR